MKLCYS